MEGANSANHDAYHPIAALLVASAVSCIGPRGQRSPSGTCLLMPAAPGRFKTKTKHPRRRCTVSFFICPKRTLLAPVSPHPVLIFSAQHARGL